MSAYVTLVCPDCGYAKVVNGRGYCRCGAYLVKAWAGMRRGVKLYLPYKKRVWFWDDDNKPRLMAGQNND